MSLRVLLVEDDELIGTLVELNLRADGHDVDWVRSGEEAAERLASPAHDVVVLDHLLPGRDGLSVARDMRRRGLGTPVLMLTVRDETRSKVAALDAGVDDYLTKPFDTQELLARVRALVRRGRAAGEPPASERICAAHGELDLEASAFTRSGRRHALTDREARLLACLAANPGRTLTRSDLIEEVWGLDASPTERTIDNFVVRLRRIVEPDPARPRFIVTVRGRGYRFEP